MITFEELKNLAMQTSSASISDAMWSDKHPHYMQGVLPQTEGKVMFGEAVTVRSLPYRPDLEEDVKAKYADRSKFPFEHALELSGEGKVMVVDASGYTNASIGGDVKFSRLHGNKGEGLVTDGALRDKSDMTNYHFALFCSGFTPRSGTGVFLYGYDLNVPVTCGGTLVKPGDYLFGDDDGVVVIPRDRAEQVLKRAVAKEKLDRFVREIIISEGRNPGEVYPIGDEIKKRFAEKEGISVEDIGW